jgi:flagellar biosynthesis protein FlhF
MKLFTFTGETPADALKKATEECGDDAFVVNTKELQKKTPSQPAIHEIVVALEMEDSPKEAPKPTPNRSNLDNFDDDVFVNLSETVKQITKITQMTDEPYHNQLKERFDTPTPTLNQTTNKVAKKQEQTVATVPLKNIQTEINKLTDKVKLIQHMIWDQDDHRKSNLIIPPEFAEIYRIAKNSGMTTQHLEAIMKQSLEHMPMSMRQNSQTVLRYFNVLLRKLAPIRTETKIQKPNKKIIMLVGPTGVGKTTTVAKLAARFAYKTESKYRVGIITVDTYRIGAVEQLMQYAKMMKLGIESVEDPLDFSAAINSLKHCDYILIDTAGSSQHDHEKIIKLKQFLNAQEDTSIDVVLTLSATTKYEDLRDIYKNFSPLGIDSIIATKMDETKRYGNIFSLIYDEKKPISYFSVGQEVPDDLIPASDTYFVDNLLKVIES